MTRKIREVPITAEGSRDKGKTFIITELPAHYGEKWALRAVRLAQRSGADIPEAVSGGMAAIAAVGIMTVLSGADKFEELEPLLDDMMRCVGIVTDAKTHFVRPIIEDGTNDDIEEIGTRILLRQVWVDLHLDFSIAAALSTLITTKTEPAAT